MVNKVKLLNKFELISIIFFIFVSLITLLILFYYLDEIIKILIISLIYK